MTLDRLARRLGVYEPVRRLDVYVRDDTAYLPTLGRTLWRRDLWPVACQMCPLQPAALAAELDVLVRLGHPYRLLAPTELAWRNTPLSEAIGMSPDRMVPSGVVHYAISPALSAIQMTIEVDEVLQWGSAMVPPGEGLPEVAETGDGWVTFAPDATIRAVAAYIVADTRKHWRANFRVLPPWIAFWHARPWWGGWRQSYGEVWRLEVWIPFWRQLGADQREAYLKRWPPPDEEWRLYFERYWR